MNHSSTYSSKFSYLNDSVNGNNKALSGKLRDSASGAGAMGEQRPSASSCAPQSSFSPVKQRHWPDPYIPFQL